MEAPGDLFTVYVVDGDDTARAAHVSLLREAGYRPIACPSAEYFLASYDPQHLAAMILDLKLPVMRGLALQEHLSENGIRLPVIVITAGVSVATAVQAMRAGAIDLIEKPAPDSRVLDALETAEQIVFDRQPQMVSRKIVASRLERLTEREREVLNHLLLGKINKEIANELDVSQRTIEGHRARIREKMHARGIADLIRMLG